VAIIGSVIVTTAIIYGGQALLARLEPVGTTIEAVSVHVAPADRPEVTLSIRAEVMLSESCTRIAQYTLARADTVPPSVYPLGQTISGAGYTAPWKGTYDIRLSVPPGIPAGAYNLVARSVYDCEWMGLLTYRVTSQAPNWRVILP